LPRQIHSVFAPGWACAAGHQPPDQIKVKVEFTANSISGWRVSTDAKGPVAATPFTITAPSGYSEYVLNRRPFGTPSACVYELPFAIIEGRIRDQGAITIRPGVLVESGWDAIMVAAFNVFVFSPNDILGVTTINGAQIPWNDFNVQASGNDVMPEDCARSNSKSDLLFGGYKYSVFPSALLEPNANLSGFQWAFCYNPGTNFRTGAATYGSEDRILKVATISVVDL